MKFSELAIKSLNHKIEQLERINSYLLDEIRILKDENVATTNALYELENRVQSQIDSLINYTMNLKNTEEPNDVY